MHRLLLLLPITLLAASAQHPQDTPSCNFDSLASHMAAATTRMPAVFIGHGSPMLAIQDSPYAPKWRAFFAKFPRPKAILCVSAHWYGRGTAVTYVDKPETIHDFGGFPRELFEVQYPAPGDKNLCNRVKELLSQGAHPRKVELAENWGLDHGAWTILKHIWPKADIPVVQLRIDSTLTPAEHIQVGSQLTALRDEGYLILGSGNVVHNLRELEWGAEGKGSDLCKKFDADVHKWVSSRDFDAIAKWESHPHAKRAHSSVDHFLPIAYIAGASTPEDTLVTINEGYDMGSLSMRSFAYVSPAPEAKSEDSKSASSSQETAKSD